MDFVQNKGLDFNEKFLKKVIHTPSVMRCGSRYTYLPVEKAELLQLLVTSVQCMDLTTLAGDDTRANVIRLCYTSINPLCGKVVRALEAEGFSNIYCGAVCVYPECVSYAKEFLSSKKGEKMNIAAVATGFPTGQYGLQTRVAEIQYAVENGATEIDIVLKRSLVLEGRWRELYTEVKACKQACGASVHMKTILSTGELGSLNNVYKASMVAMMAGSDFIKTSTGKEGVNAIIPVGIVMCRAIRDFYDITGVRVGLKPAGGVRTFQDAVSWINLVRDTLGNDWVNPHLFRIGASGLLDNVHKQLFMHLLGHQPGEFDYLD